MKEKIFFLVVVVCLLAFNLLYGGDTSSDTRLLSFFYSPSCHGCMKLKNEFMPPIEEKYRNQIEVKYLDITDIENYKSLLSLKKQHGLTFEISWPVVYFAGRFLVGYEQVNQDLEMLLIEALKEKAVKNTNSPLEVDLTAHFKTIKPLAVISAGLIDGINPCAFTVIVFFISFLALQGYRKRELVFIGMAFIFAVFLTYVLIGLGLFGFLYRMKNFWMVTKIFNFSIGIFSVALGGFAVYDFLKFKKTGKTEGLLLQLPAAVKNQIHSVIGMHYRQPLNSRSSSKQRPILKLLISAMITGFLVSLLEAVCTGQVYLPTITFVLKTTDIKLEASIYLILYNLMFITPLLVIFFFALMGVTSQQFSEFLKKNMLAIKILMAVLFFVLGAFLIWRA